MITYITGHQEVARWRVMWVRGDVLRCSPARPGRGSQTSAPGRTWGIQPERSFLRSSHIQSKFKTQLGYLESARIHEIVHLNSLGELPKFSASSSEENFNLIWIVRNDIWGRIMGNRLGQNCIKSSCTCEPSEYRLDRGSWREPATLTSLLQKPWMRNPA